MRKAIRVIIAEQSRHLFLHFTERAAIRIILKPGFAQTPGNEGVSQVEVTREEPAEVVAQSCSNHLYQDFSFNPKAEFCHQFACFLLLALEKNRNRESS